MCNLRTTYADDAAVVAALFTMSERIKAHCKEIKKSPAASIVHKE
jgi:uncharacterized membrane protein YkvA (DUF1232 family)